MLKILAIISVIMCSSVCYSDVNEFSRYERGRPGHSAHNAARRGFRHGGHIGSPARLHLPRAPYGGWRGHYYNGYYVWAYGAWAPWWGWAPYYGWRIGLGYYVPEGLRCYATNDQVGGEWRGVEAYYSSDDAIDSALGACENSAEVYQQRASDFCRIRTCERW